MALWHMPSIHHHGGAEGIKRGGGWGGRGLEVEGTCLEVTREEERAHPASGFYDVD